MCSKQMVSRFTYLILVTCLLGLAFLGACSKATPTSSTTKPATTTIATTTSVTPKTGGTLRIGTGVDAVYLGNPPLQTTVQDFVTSKTCVESLGRYDSSGQMTPWLADSWKTDATTKTITVTLKKGITFQDGTPFDASAVKWNLDRFFAAKRAELPAGSTVDVVDSYTVKLTLPTWDNTAIIGMGYFAGPQVSPTAWQKAADNDKDRDAYINSHPVGTGPFMFTNWNKTVKQVYTKNPNYWQKGKPYLDSIEWDFYADPTVMQAAYLNKEIDIIYILSPISARDLKASGANIVSLTTGMGLQLTSVWYNSINSTSPFSNLQVRQAVSYSVDAPSIVNSLYYGYATAINQWAVPTSQWCNPNYKGYAYDPDKAKQLLAAAGFTGLHTHMLVLNTPDTVATATALQAMFAKAGMTVDLDIADNARYRQLTSPGGSFDAMCLASQRADSDPAMIFPRNLSDSGVIMNKTIIHPAQIESLLAQAKAAPDQASKKAVIWNEQQVIFGDYCMFTPLLVPSGICAKQSYVKNDGLMDIEYTQWTPEDAWLNK